MDLAKQLLSCCLLLICIVPRAQTHTLSGYIRDAQSGENLIGATIWQVGTNRGTTSNSFGFYSFTSTKKEITIRVSYIGYQPQQVSITLEDDMVHNFNLRLGDALDEVVVTAEENIELTPQMSAVSVPIRQVEKLPVIMGESDILKTLQLLPGIQGGTEGFSGIYVRGGGPDQNLILLDGVPVYNISHLFGFFSIFNPDAINNASVIKGGFPARYGGRLSSVVDISLKEGNNQKLTGAASIGIISSNLTLEGPIGKSHKTSFIVSGRRTYIDLLARPFFKTDQSDVSYYFYDINAKINHRFSQQDRLYFSIYNGQDKGYSELEKVKNDVRKYDYTQLGWGNTIMALRWNHVYGPSLFSNVSCTFSKYHFDITNQFTESYVTPPSEIVSSKSIKYGSGIQDMGLKLDFDYTPTPSHNFRFGSSLLYHQFNPGIFGFNYSDNTQDTIAGNKPKTAIEIANYIEDDFTITPSLRGNIGAHYSLYMIDQQIYHSLQPRVSLRYLATNNLSFKASYATMTQYIHLLTNATVGLPTDLWVPATPQAEPQTSWQAALGAAQTVNGYELSIETYYKSMYNLIEYREGTSFFNQSTNWEDKVTSGSGESYGTELLIQKKTGKLSGWLGYTLSWTKRQFDEVNNGNVFPYKYDRRHDISLVGSYQFSEKFTLSGTWVYGTGNAITIPRSTYTTAGYEHTFHYYYANDLIYYGKRNSYRMAAYHRLDIGATWTNVRPKTTRIWSVGAYNLYNRKNPFYIDRVTDYNNRYKYVQYSLFPIIPYVKYSIKF